MSNNAADDKVILIAQENARPENSFLEDPASPSTQRNKKRNTALFFVIAVFFNVLYVASVFDTYFLTSLSTNIAPISQTAQAPADRVVIFLADGTKADAFFSLHSDGTPVTPFFRHIMETKGSYGVSFTQVPTESRTCSVAIMGGFYEDPSAITKGWSENPVNYDHFLNETTWGWGYGTPNIISLFYSNGKKEQTVNTSGFPESMLDFGATPSELDDWAINALSEVLDTMAPQNETLNEMLRTPKVGIFVHLIGGDTAAHGHKPYSSVYYDTISHYDQLINNTVAKIDAFFNDSKTAYIFTSDHGLTNSGTHGDGAPNNTKTPFVAWGAGISGPIREKVKGESHDELSRPWGLEGLTRRDIHQVDISPLLSSLVGVPVPVNNMGMLPLEYLDVDQKSKSEFLLTNARQVCAIYQKKDQDKRKDEPFFISYKVSVDDVNSAISSIGSSIQSGKYEESQVQSRELIQDCRDGINYLQRYDWLLLFSIVILGYIGYSIYGMTTTLRKFSDNYSDELYSNYKRLTIGKLLYLVFSVCLLTFFVLKKAPLQYYGYALFPLYFWFDLIFNGRNVFRSITITKAQIGYSLFFITCLGLLVWCQFERRILSLTYVVIAAWQVLARRDISQKMLILWVTSCIVMAIFPLMPPIGSRDVYLYTLGWLLTVAIIIFGTVYWKEKMSWPSIISKACVLLSFYIANDSDRLLFSGGVSMFNKTIAWGILVMTIVFPMIFELNSTRHFMLRLLSVFTCLSSLMIILSTSYELLFFACFAVQLAIWVQMEKVSVQDSRHSLGLHHLKNSFFILFFANIAFFGMGNLASINFNLESVFRFVTVFSPFIMTGLLIVRIMLPFVLLAIATTTVSKHSMRLPSSSMLIIPMLSFGAGVTMSMFLLVKNTGSWLEMGNSLARFIIASLFILIILALAGLGYLLMRKSKDEFELQGYEFSVKKGDPTDISDTDLKSVNV